MEQERIERDRIRLISSERTVLELFLIVYPFLFVTVNAVVSSHYMWLLLSVFTGILSYLLFGKIEYSFGIGIGIAMLLTVPFYFNGMPLIVVIALFIYSFWRLHTNFSNSKSHGWPFLLMNTILFTFFYLITKLIFVNANPYEVMNIHVALFGITTILYFVNRFTVIGLIGRRLKNFSLTDTGEMFGGLLGLGFLTFFAVYFLVQPIRLTIVAIATFLFSGIFMLIGKTVTPFIDWFIAKLDESRAKSLEGAEDEFIYIDFSMQNERVVFGATFKDTELLIIAGIISVIFLLLMIIVKSRKKAMLHDKDLGYTYRSYDRTQKMKKKQLIYDYSQAENTIRNAYKKFEEAAQLSKVTRLRGETVKEWFSRMGWETDELLFNTYDLVRYGAKSVTEEEGIKFVDDLERIKNKYFADNV